jgi:hypothetical protein
MSKIFTLQDLSDLPREERPWVVKDMIRAGKRSFAICGSPEAGKSTLATQLAKAVARGEDFLGRPTTQGRVIYWQSEEDAQDAAEDFLPGTSPSDPIVVIHPSPSDDNIQELDAVMDQYPDTRLCIIETLVDFFQSDDLDSGPENARKFAALEGVISKYPQCAFGMLHWFKKSDMQRGLSIHKMLGSTVIAGKTGTKIFLHEVSDSDSRRVIQVRVRKGVKIEPTYLNWDAATKTSTLGIPVALEQQGRKVVVGEHSKAIRKTKLFSVVAANEGAATDAICKIAGGKKTTNLTDLAELENDGKVYSLKRQGPSKNATQWFVAKGTPEELFLKFENQTYDPRPMATFYYGLPDTDKRLVWNKYPQHWQALKEKESLYA